MYTTHIIARSNGVLPLAVYNVCTPIIIMPLPNNAAIILCCRRGGNCKHVQIEFSFMS